jgi:hypothetical protein
VNLDQSAHWSIIEPVLLVGQLNARTVAASSYQGSAHWSNIEPVPLVVQLNARTVAVAFYQDNVHWSNIKPAQLVVQLNASYWVRTRWPDTALAYRVGNRRPLLRQ